MSKKKQKTKLYSLISSQLWTSTELEMNQNSKVPVTNLLSLAIHLSTSSWQPRELIWKIQSKVPLSQVFNSHIYSTGVHYNDWVMDIQSGHTGS